eukprot:4276659-Prymnesium_polylepis.1
MARNVNVTVRDIRNGCDTFRNRLPHLPRRKRLGMRNIPRRPCDHWVIATVCVLRVYGDGGREQAR